MSDSDASAIVQAMIFLVLLLAMGMLDSKLDRILAALEKKEPPDGHN